MTINKHLLKAQQNLRNGAYAKAIEILDKHLKLYPTDISGLMIRGEAYLRSEQFESALTDYAKVVESDNKNILALNNFSLALIRCGKPHEAKDVIAYVHELDPKNFPAYINLGNIHQALGEYQEAVNSALQAVQLDPKAALAYLNLGTSLGSLGLREDSKQAYLMAEFLDPSSVFTKINLAQIEEKCENRNEAKLIYENVLKLKNITPLESELVKYYLSYIYLFQGNLESGWIFYDFGFGSLLPASSLRSARKFTQPKWQGQAVTGTLLVWREQGLGDEIVFSTCLFDVYSLFTNVILECEPRLVQAYQRTFPKWQIRPESVTSDKYPLTNDFDVHIPIGSLPGLFRKNINNFKNENSLFTSSSSLKEKFAKRLQPYKDKILVGISWRGGLLTILRNDNYTSILDWKEILTLPNCQFVNLQYGDCEAELIEAENLFGISILRWADLDLKNDLESVMGLVSNLNHIVSVGTAISTIAPALGVHTILLTRPSWLMLGERDRFPWFDCVTPLVTKGDEIVASKLKSVPALLT
jgi:tetratricopeptide (TPR) repeat protein